jgi:hypothetical protein
METQVSYSWNMTSLNETQLELQVNFSQPLHVSNHGRVADKAVFTVVKDKLFIAANDKEALPKGF